MDSKQTILAAAERQFAERGFAATTIKHIAADADVNPALLYYYFADKEALYDAVFESALAGFTARLRAGLDGGASPVEAIRGLVRAQARALTERPTLPRLLLREMLDSEGARAGPHIVHFLGGSFAQFCEQIRQGQRHGVFRGDLMPERAAISTIAQLVYFFISQPALVTIAGSSRDSFPGTIEMFAEHAANFALAALGVPAHVPEEQHA